MMISCQKASQLQSLAMDRHLAIKDRLALIYHHWMCTSCRRFGRQLNWMRKALRQEPLTFLDTGRGEGLSEARKKAIKSKLHQDLTH